jgi:hypothetical protein
MQSVPQGVARGWRNRCPFGADGRTTSATNTLDHDGVLSRSHAGKTARILAAKLPHLPAEPARLDKKAATLGNVPRSLICPRRRRSDASVDAIADRKHNAFGRFVGGDRRRLANSVRTRGRCDRSTRGTLWLLAGFSPTRQAGRSDPRARRRGEFRYAVGRRAGARQGHQSRLMASSLRVPVQQGGSIANPAGCVDNGANWRRVAPEIGGTRTSGFGGCLLIEQSHKAGSARCDLGIAATYQVQNGITRLYDEAARIPR